MNQNLLFSLILGLTLGLTGVMFATPFAGVLIGGMALLLVYIGTLFGARNKDEKTF